MEPMSVETLLLSAWEEDGFIGKARVPLGNSDVDVLAVHAAKGEVRIAELKVQMGSQFIWIVDDGNVADMEVEGRDFTWWMDDWSGWLEKLPQLWESDGQPKVPWLLPANTIKAFEAVFCCNLQILADPAKVDAALQRAVQHYLKQNPGLASGLQSGMEVRAQVRSTVAIMCELVRLVRQRISNDRYGRRFGNPFKDMVREVHRYLRPQLHRLPRDAQGDLLATRKQAFEADIRRKTTLVLLEALGVERQELKEWLAVESPV